MKWSLRGLGAVLLASLAWLVTGCGDDMEAEPEGPSTQRELAIEQVRFNEEGFFPYQILKGRMFLYSDKMINQLNRTWYPPVGKLIKDPTAVRVFEETDERPVLTLKRVTDYPNKMNLLTIVTVGPGIADSMVADSPLHPAFGKTLEALTLGADDGAFNLALALCWGDREWPERVRSDEQLATLVGDLRDGQYLYPGPSIGNPMDCMLPLIADLDWLQRATPEKAEEATKRNRTLHMFFPPDNQNWRSGVLLITDGTPFREGSLRDLVDVLQRTNFPLYTIGVNFSREGNEGLSRLRNLYETGSEEGAGLSGKFTTVGNLAEAQNAIRQLQRRFVDDTYVAEYISGFSGNRFKPLPRVEVKWFDNRYQSPPATVSPPKYLAWIRQALWALTGLLIISLIVYILYINQIWPFNPKLRVVTCPTGCGRMIPDDWPRCKFCETDNAWGRLVLLSGDRAGEVFFLKEDTYSLGASPKDDIVLTQIAESPVKETHASLHWLRQGQKIVVQGRSGEVKLGEAPIPPGGANLAFGDILEFGDGGVSAILLRGVSLVH